MGEQTIRWFAGAAHAVGLESETVEPGELTGRVREALVARHPAAATVLQRCSFLADGQRLGADSPWPISAAVVDVLPPFTGG